MAQERLKTALSRGLIVVSDGAWGTMLQQRGLKPGTCPELMCLEQPEVVYGLARDYIEAGSNMVETNSFGGNKYKLDHYGLGERVGELNEEAAKLSRRAAGDDNWVLGSMGPTGKMIVMGDITEDDFYAAFKEQAAALERGGADAVIVETMSSTDEAVQGVKAVSENTGLDIICSFTFEQTVRGDFRTMMGVSPKQAAEAGAGAGAHMLGINCGNGYDGLENVLREMHETAPELPILIQPNAGIPTTVNGVDVFQATPEEMAERVSLWIESGARIIGGCCGTTPEHIKAIRRAVDTYGNSV